MHIAFIRSRSGSATSCIWRSYSAGATPPLRNCHCVPMTARSLRNSKTSRRSMSVVTQVP